MYHTHCLPFPPDLQLLHGRFRLPRDPTSHLSNPSKVRPWRLRGSRLTACKLPRFVYDSFFVEPTLSWLSQTAALRSWSCPCCPLASSCSSQAVLTCLRFSRVASTGRVMVWQTFDCPRSRPAKDSLTFTLQAWARPKPPQGFPLICLIVTGERAAKRLARWTIRSFLHCSWILFVLDRFFIVTWPSFEPPFPHLSF